MRRGGGCIPFRTETMTVAIYQNAMSGELVASTAVALLLLIFFLHCGIPRYNLRHLVEVSRYVSQAVRIPISPRRPVVGDDIFTCESGIHVDGIIKNPSNYEPFDPAEVSMRRKFLIGKKTGRSALRHKLKSLGTDTEDRLPEELLMKVKNESSRLKTSFTDEELLRFCSIRSEAVSP